MKKLALLFIIVSFLGFLDASYLALEHYRGVVPPCSIVVGCEIVTTSRYSLIFNIPVALLGSLYYLTVLILTIAYFDTKLEPLIHLAAQITVVGFLGSLWFMYVQFFLLHAFCTYCIGSALSSTILFILGIRVLGHRETWWHKVLRKLKLQN